MATAKEIQELLAQVPDDMEVIMDNSDGIMQEIPAAHVVYGLPVKGIKMIAVLMDEMPSREEFGWVNNNNSEPYWPPPPGYPGWACISRSYENVEV